MAKKNRGKEELTDDKTKKDKSIKVYQKDKIKFELNIAERDDFTQKQKDLSELILNKNTKVVFIQGPAGTSKSFISIYSGLHLLNKKSVSDIVYIRSIIESASRSLGALPGSSEEKLNPFLMPLHDKLDELLPKSEVDLLKKEDRVQGIPINHLRGASINAKYVIIDEAQNLDFRELTTALTRIGKYSKFIILGDPFQSDLPLGRSGFIKMFDLFNNESAKEQGIHCFSFTREDIVRSGILKYIVETIEGGYPTTLHKEEPMFPAKS
jgi:phosphate starvation-inducible PhoH-like protein